MYSEAGVNSDLLGHVYPFSSVSLAKHRVNQSDYQNCPVFFILHINNLGFGGFSLKLYSGEYPTDFYYYLFICWSRIWKEEKQKEKADSHFYCSDLQLKIKAHPAI